MPQIYNKHIIKEFLKTSMEKSLGENYYKRDTSEAKSTKKTFNLVVKSEKSLWKCRYNKKINYAQNINMLKVKYLLHVTGKSKIYNWLSKA